LPDFLDGVEDASVDRLLLEGAQKALGYPVGLGLLQEGEAGGDAPGLDLVLEAV